MKTVLNSSGVTMTWKIPEPPTAINDAIFFTGEGLVLSLSYKGFAVDVYCDGVTNATLLNTEGEVVAHMYDGSDFINAGLDTDDAVQLANEQELINWINNAWFDLYCEGEHLDVVTHDLHEAIESAEEYLKQQYKDEQNLIRDFDTAEIV